MLDFLLARGKEPSSWRGFSLFLTAFGIYVEPALYAQITTVGMGVAGLIGMFTADKKAVK